MRLSAKSDDDDDDKKSLEGYGIFMFTGDVDDERCDETVRWILEENLGGRHELLTLVVNSPGGYLSSGFAVVDVMHGSRLPIRTVGLGQIASMGLMMFIAGEKGERILTPNTLIMSHQWAGGDYGKEHELVAGLKRNTLVSDMVTRHYRKHTGLSVKQIRKYLLPPHDVYLSAKEAKELGICDQIRLF